MMEGLLHLLNHLGLMLASLQQQLAEMTAERDRLAAMLESGS